MKELSYIDLKKIIEEMQFLEGSKIDQIYMPGKKELILQIHVPSKGKHLIRVNVPGFMYLTGYKPKSDHPPGFCMFLRKKIRNGRIQKIEQIPNERIIRLDISTKDENYQLYIELFLKGNVVLCKDNKIISPLENQNWKDRTIRGGIEYKFIEKEHEELKEKLGDSLVRFLAKKLNLGGMYAEEVCLQTGIDKNKTELKKEEMQKLNRYLEELYRQEPKGLVYRDEKDEVKAITFFELKQFESSKKEEFKTFNKALDSVLTTKQKIDIEKTQTKKHDVKKNKFEKIIKAQEKQLEKINKKIEDSSKKGELIYNNYQLLSNILAELNKARKKYSWKEMQEKLKEHKVIKKIDPKTKTIIVELEE